MGTMRYPLIIRLIHLGLILFGITAFLTGELAEDGEAMWGYLVHAYLGLALTFFILSRAVVGVAGPGALRFINWVPFSRERFRVVIEDIKLMARLKLPEHQRHEGVSALVHVFGLLLFLWMGLTGTVLYFIPDYEASMVGEFFAEIHEVGESLIPLFLILHIGAVVLHTVLGHSILKRMLSFGRVNSAERVSYDEEHQN